MDGASRQPKEFADLPGLYGEAEGFAKEVEVTCSAIASPAINQLRYAGHHLLRGLASECHGRFQEELKAATDHCHRSMYEASEAGLG